MPGNLQQVSSIHPRGAYLDQDLAGTGDRTRHLDYARLTFDCFDCPHRPSLKDNPRLIRNRHPPTSNRETTPRTSNRETTTRPRTGNIFT